MHNVLKEISKQKIYFNSTRKDYDYVYSSCNLAFNKLRCYTVSYLILESLYELLYFSV